MIRKWNAPERIWNDLEQGLGALPAGVRRVVSVVASVCMGR